MDIIALIGLIVASIGFMIATASFLYVKLVAVRKLDQKIETMQGQQEEQQEMIEQIMANDGRRVGIEPKKELIKQLDGKNQNPQSSRTTGSESSHFVSYFGLCFQQQPQHIGGDPKKEKSGNIVNDEEQGLPCQSIEIPQHTAGEDMYDANTPPTDVDSGQSSTDADSGQSSIESSIGDVRNEEIIDKKSEDDVEMMRNSGTSIESIDSMEISSDEDDISFVTPLKDSDDDSDGEGGNLKDDDSENTFKTPEEHDIDELDKVLDDILDFVISPDSAKEEVKDDSPLSSNDDSAPFSPTINEVAKSTNDMTQVAIDDIELKIGSQEANVEDGNHDTPHITDSQTYFSSDDDVSSEGYINERPMDNDDEFRSGRFMIQKIDSSLTLPDLTVSDSNSGNWELSSSSEDASVEDNISTKQRRKKVHFKPIIELNPLDENIINFDNTNSLDTCMFCHKQYKKEIGVRFSYYEDCHHLMCGSCCEEGKAAQLSGKCPECDYQQNVPRIPISSKVEPQHVLDVDEMSI